MVSTVELVAKRPTLHHDIIDPQARWRLIKEKLEHSMHYNCMRRAGKTPLLLRQLHQGLKGLPTRRFPFSTFHNWHSGTLRWLWHSSLFQHVVAVVVSPFICFALPADIAKWVAPYNTQCSALYPFHIPFTSCECGSFMLASLLYRLRVWSIYFNAIDARLECNVGLLL